MCKSIHMYVYGYFVHICMYVCQIHWKVIVFIKILCVHHKNYMYTSMNVCVYPHVYVHMCHTLRGKKSITHTQPQHQTTPSFASDAELPIDTRPQITKQRRRQQSLPVIILILALSARRLCLSAPYRSLARTLSVSRSCSSARIYCLILWRNISAFSWFSLGMLTTNKNAKCISNTELTKIKKKMLVVMINILIDGYVLKFWKSDHIHMYT